VPHASGVLVTICHMHMAAMQANPPWGRMDNDIPHFELQTNPPFGDFRKVWSVLTHVPQIEKDGYMTVPQEPGLGVTIQPDLIERT
jgi:L-alanine-DL-glutamate epimerase-like enolase superfamily enzyme